MTSWPACTHQGEHDHSSDVGYNADRARINALKEMGFDVIEVTSGQVGDLMAFEALVMRIARATGKRVDASKLGPIPSRLELRRELFSWNRAGGRRA